MRWAGHKHVWEKCIYNFSQKVSRVEITWKTQVLMEGQLILILINGCGGVDWIYQACDGDQW
jgi:hypothetical protein